MAEGRWKILRRAVLASKTDQQLKTDVESSTRSFSSFGLFRISPNRALQAGYGEPWLDYTYTSDDEVICEASVKTLQATVTLEDMVGFNNTGNVCVWPAEEVMAYHCLVKRDMFFNATVCELGCGMTGLAGVMLASTKSPAHVLLTDGNDQSVKNVREIIDINKGRFDGDTKVNCDILRWESSTSLKPEHDRYFDYVLSADCLFFNEVHQELLLLIKKLLKPEKGIAILFAPKRGHTLEQFCDVAKNYFEVDCTEHYNDQVWKIRNEMPENFILDRHYPIKIVLK